jgi:hypothetical protein
MAFPIGLLAPVKLFVGEKKRAKYPHCSGRWGGGPYRTVPSVLCSAVRLSHEVPGVSGIRSALGPSQSV